MRQRRYAPSKRKFPVLIGLLILILAFLALAMSQGWFVPEQGALPPEDSGLFQEETPPIPEGIPESETLDEDELPHDKLFITVERQKYEDGDLKLVIPKLEIDDPIWDGTTEADLAKGACLFEYAQLPDEGNRNVSLAAHRNGRRGGVVTDDGLFYYIHELTEGDLLYLHDQEKIYVYRYLDTKVVEADDWGPIYSQGFSVLTLTSCEPIGISTHRMIVRADLQEILDYDPGYVYEASEQR